MRRAKAIWNSGMQFIGVSGSGHGIVIDTRPKDGGTDTGPSNTELLLLALCGCTGMDVMMILNKKRLKIDGFQVEAVGEVPDQLPKVMKRIELTYKVWGGVSEAALQQAIELSHEKYCTVSNTLKGRADISYRYEINPDGP